MWLLIANRGLNYQSSIVNTLALIDLLCYLVRRYG